MTLDYTKLRQNAPSVAQQILASKTSRLTELRRLYAIADTPQEKQRYTEEADELKREIQALT